VLNRAAVFTLVSAIVIGVFVLAEWGASEWLASTSHTTSAVIAVLVRSLWVSQCAIFINTWTGSPTTCSSESATRTKPRRAAPRRFAHQSAYITDRSILPNRAIAAVNEHCGSARLDPRAQWDKKFPGSALSGQFGSALGGFSAEGGNASASVAKEPAALRSTIEHDRETLLRTLRERKG
jgi:hypothetical protein